MPLQYIGSYYLREFKVQCWKYIAAGSVADFSVDQTRTDN